MESFDCLVKFMLKLGVFCAAFDVLEFRDKPVGSPLRSWLTKEKPMREAIVSIRETA